MFLRHGEKPSGGYGQLTCQGLNRSLALPDILPRSTASRPTYNDIVSLEAALVTPTKADTTIFVA